MNHVSSTELLWSQESTKSVDETWSTIILSFEDPQIIPEKFSKDTLIKRYCGIYGVTPHAVRRCSGLEVTASIF